MEMEVEVKEVKGDGCTKEDYIGMEKKVVLVENNGECDLYTKAILAEDEGVILLMIWSKTLFNTRIRSVEWKEGEQVIQMPVMSITSTVKDVLISSISGGGGAYINFTTNTIVETHATYNVFAETKKGKKDNIIFPGSHLDSVQAGPGLNDNGSGSATLLTLALQLYSIQDQLENSIRFGWWGAEEEGLLGSRHYVRTLTLVEKEKIAIYINHDMLASPNYIIDVHNTSDAMYVLEGGKTVQQMYENYYSSRNIPFTMDPMRSGSDFVPFVEANISSCGMAAGAGRIKTSNERNQYGGLANGLDI
jgi:Zn-dependent M28 family amino/carboxypeptidase